MFESIFRREYRVLNKVIISQSALESNLCVLQKYHPEAKVVPVLKSNAYGHGLTTVAPIFDNLRPEFLVVDSLYEAYELSKLKIKSKTLILGYTKPINFAVKKIPFHVTVFDFMTAEALNHYQRNCKIHIFIDTGMNREGVRLEELRGFVRKIKKLKNLEVVGLASHLAEADNPKTNIFTHKQIHKYKQALMILREGKIDPIYRHISASGGAYKVKDEIFNMIRAGIASYGVSPLVIDDNENKNLELRPALKLVSTLVQISRIEEGERVGYGGTFTARRKMILGLLPLGYYEGVDRRLSNKGMVQIQGVYCPIVGRVSMNMTTVDISKIKKPRVGEEVVVYSDHNNDQNSITWSARLAGTIPYDILVHISRTIRRELT